LLTHRQPSNLQGCVPASGFAQQQKDLHDACIAQAGSRRQEGGMTASLKQHDKRSHTEFLLGLVGAASNWAISGGKQASKKRHNTPNYLR
jgi:hypothetical protein